MNPSPTEHPASICLLAYTLSCYSLAVGRSILVVHTVLTGAFCVYLRQAAHHSILW